MADIIELSKMYKSVLNNLNYFKNETPDSDELVRAKILSIDEVGVRCFLTDYKLEAFMPFQEASNSKRMFRIKKELKINKTYVAKTVNVDKYKKYVDISIRNVYDDESKEFLSNITNYEKLIMAVVKSYIFKANKIEDINNFLRKTVYKISLERMPVYIKRYRENNEYFYEKIENLSEYIDKASFQEYITSFIIPPSFQLVTKLRINSTSINAKYDIINYITEINKSLNYDFNFDATPYFVSKTKHVIEKNIDKDTSLIKKNIKNYIDNSSVDKLYVLIEDVSIEEI